MIDLRLRGSQHKIIYSIAADDGDWYSKLVKIDASTGLVLYTWAKNEHWPSEPTFIPDPSAKGEDDGVIISIVLDGTRQVRKE